jgi:hypothetical protein
MSRRRLLPFVLAALVGSAIGTGAAIAHSNSYFDMRWSTSRGNIPVYFDRTTPTGAFRERVRDAFDQWERFQTKVGFSVYTETAPATAPDQPNGADDACRRTNYQNRRISLISYQYIDGKGDNRFNILAETQGCEINSGGSYLLDFFYLAFDTGDDYYMGTGNAPSKSIDLWSTATHEIGHAMGWGPHFDDNGTNNTICNNDSDQQTMCASYYAGSERQRTLEGHDKDTFTNRYP